jgi:hypothetical protein
MFYKLNNPALVGLRSNLELAMYARVCRFFLVQQNTKRPDDTEMAMHIPNGHEIHRICHPKAFQNVPKLV